MANVRLDQQGKTVVLAEGLTVSHEVVFELFDRASASDYDRVFEQALVLGAYALQIDEIGQMLDRASMDLDGRLMQVKMLFELRGLKERSAAKGDILEQDLSEVLQKEADNHGWTDEITLVGGTIGAIPRRKVGDLLVSLQDAERSIVVEAKFDKSFALGDPAGLDKSASSEKSAHGQNYLALASRESDFSIFVVDANNCHKTILDAGRLVFVPEQPGFIAVVDRARGDWGPLLAAYGVARVLALATEAGSVTWEPVGLIIKRLDRALQMLASLDKNLADIGVAAAAITKNVDGLADTREKVKNELATLTTTLAAWADNPVSARQRMDLYLGE